MTEINPNIEKITRLDPALENNKGQKEGDKGFNQILTDKLASKDVDQSIIQTSSSLPEIDAVYKTGLMEGDFDTSLITGKIAASLDQLDTYSAWLNNPDRSLKQIWSLLQEVIENTQNIEDELKANSDTDKDLTDIVTQILTTANVEQIKIQRGDYL